VRAEDTDWLARLHQERLVGLERAQAGEDALEALPVPCRPTDAAVDHELGWFLRHLRVEVVHQHPQRRFGKPPFRRDVCAARSRHEAGVVDGGHVLLATSGPSQPVPAGASPEPPQTARKCKGRPRILTPPPSRAALSFVQNEWTSICGLGPRRGRQPCNSARQNRSESWRRSPSRRTRAISSRTPPFRPRGWKTTSSSTSTRM